MYPTTKLLLEDNIFLSSFIKKYIALCKIVHTRSSSNYDLFFFSKYDQPKKHILRIDKLFDRINKHILPPYKINIFIYDYPKPRILSTIMRKHYINGGFTFRNTQNIYIYRMDELEKVCLHEIFHHIYNPLDQECPRLTSLLEKRFGKINLAEAITEFIATICHLKIISTEYEEPFKDLLEDELKHSLTLCQKIKTIKNPHITNIVSYITLKYILLLNVDQAIKNIHNPCNIADILIQFDYDTIIPREINGKETFTFMVNSNR